jgi:predicted SnoaL-like aldol condensation-catalyzing enzyme
VLAIMNPETDLKEIASDFLRRASSGDVREAFRLYVAPNFRHHNAYFPGDAEPLMKGMEENAKQNPDKSFDIKRVLRDGNLIAVHGHVRHNPTERGYALVHIFRFEDDKMVEMWDIGQEVPEKSPNQYGMF